MPLDDLSREPDHNRRLQLIQKAAERKWSADALAARISNAPHGYGRYFKMYDQLVLDLAREYSCRCGILSIDELGSIYHEVCQTPSMTWTSRRPFSTWTRSQKTRTSRDYWDRHVHRSGQYVAGILKSIYWQAPLWEENGRSARELDEESLGDVA